MLSTIPVLPTEAIVGALFEVFKIVSAFIVIAQISLFLFKKLLSEWRETVDQLREIRPPKSPPDKVN